GRYADARRLAAKALAHHTPDASLLFHAGMIHARLGDRATAQRQLAQALSLNPAFDPIDGPVAAATLAELGARAPDEPPPQRAARAVARALPARLGLVDEDQQVEVARRVAELGQRRGDLAAMVGRVVHLVDDLLPERVGPALAARVAVRDDLGEIGVGQAGHEALRVRLDLAPARAQGRHVGKLARVQQRRRRGALPAREPDPLRGHDVHEGLAHRAEAGAARLRELVRTQARRVIEEARRGPGAVAIERANG